jgi:LysM repeat protein
MRSTLLFVFISLFLAIAFGIIMTDAQITCGDTLTVQSGDTLAEIAQTCETTVPALLATNPEIIDLTALEVGQVIVLPTAVNDVDPLVAISPQRGGPGTTVTVIANGFPLLEEVTVEMGSEGNPAMLTRRVNTDNAGGMITTLTIPDDANPATPRWLVTVAGLETGFIARSFPFIVTDTPPVDSPRTFTQTQVYLVDSDSAPEGQICMEAVVPYTIDIQPTVAPLTAAIESMLTTPEYPVEELYNAFSLSNLTLNGIDINDGEAEIALSGELVTLGQCDSQWMPAQIRQTALQYTTIDDVVITVNGEPIEDVIASRGI